MSIQPVFPQHKTPEIPYSINCRGRLLSLSKPVVMGILNLSPDSFYDGGRLNNRDALLKQAEQHLRGGASILDVGGASSRPGAEFVEADVELKRTASAVGQLRAEFPHAFISVDTWRSRVADAAVREGADIINDISGGELDPEIVEIAISNSTPYVLMHMLGSPKTMQDKPVYSDVTREVISSIQSRVATYRKRGLNDIIVDPGFGFGKSVSDNYKLLADLHRIGDIGCPLLVGFSRKSMINKVIGTLPEQALNGTTVLNTVALLNGASILRVHDANEARQCILLIDALRNRQTEGATLG
ncbi:MAG: dihydropteroate synthase [Bacteroidota bacterium]